MLLLELIARRARSEAEAFSLPELLAGQALAQVSGAEGKPINGLIAKCLVAELLQDTPDDARRFAELLLDRGVGEARLFNTYAAKAAEILGKGWEDDTLSFAQVTHAMGHLMLIAREMAGMANLPAAVKGRTRALMARAPGEEHVFGLLLTAQEMRRIGWLVRVDLSGDEAALSAAFNTQDFDIVGFTAAAEARIPALRHAIALTRRMQRDARVVVGGRLGASAPDTTAAELGADLVVGCDPAPLEKMTSSFALEAV